MNNKKLLFLPGYYYLTLPLFFEIIKNKNNFDFQDIFFHTDDPLLAEINNKYSNLSEIEQNFSEVARLSNADLYQLYKYTKYGFLKRIYYFPAFVHQLKKIRIRLENKLNEISPDLIISTGGNTLNIFCNSWANKHNIPFVLIQPAFLELSKKASLFKLKNYFLNTLFKLLIGTPINSESHLFGDAYKDNYLFVWSERIKQNYIHSRIYSRIKVCGNPLHDKYTEIRSTETDWSKIGCNPVLNRKIIAICPQTLERFSHLIGKKDADEINEIYFSIVNHFEDIFFIIKTHPMQKHDYEFYVNLFSGIKHNNYFISIDADLKEVFKVSDLQLSFSSATSFEAIIQDVAVMLIKPDLLETPEFRNTNIFLRANNEKEAIAQIEYGITNEYKIKFNQNREQYLANFGLFDGLSSKRIINELENILVNY